MNVKLSKGSRQVGHLLLGAFAIQGAAILVFILLARWLTVADFASYRQLFLIHQLIAGVLFAAIPTSLLYFCGSNSSSARGRIVRLHFFFVLSAGGCAFLVLFFGGKIIGYLLSNPRLGELSPIFAPYSAAYMIYSLVGPSFLAFGRSGFSSSFSIFLGLLNSVPVIVVAASGEANLSEIVLASSGSACLGAVVATYFLWTISRSLCGQDKKSSADICSLKAILAYLWPLLIAGGLGLLGLRMDQIVVASLLGPEVFGIYSVGAFEIPLFGMLQSSVSAVLLPQFSEWGKSKNWSAICTAWRKALIRSALIVYPVAAVLFVLAEPFMEFMFGDKFKESSSIFRIYLLLTPIRVMTFGLVLRAIGDTKSDLIGSTIYLVVVTLGAYLGAKIIGAAGAMSAVVLATAGLGAWLILRTYKASDGFVTLSKMYPIGVFLFFPFLIAIYSFFLNDFVFYLFDLSEFEKLSAGGLVCSLSILLGLRMSSRFV